MNDLKETFIPTRRAAMDDFQPRLVNGDPGYQRRELAASVLPKGSTLGVAPQRREAAGFFSGTPMGVSPTGGGGGGGSSMYHMQRPYMPQVESPDRVQYPKSRAEANEDWRLFHRVDPIFGTAIDMYAEMLVSEFDIVVGDEKSTEIRDTLEYMCQTTNLMDRLRYIIREYLVIGEAIPHTFFDDDLGIWTYIGMHNPDYVDVVDAPIVNMEPILNFVPDENLRRLLSDGSPESREFKARLPAEFVSKIMARQKIRLSPLNASFIPRKMHPYESRGTSLASRMWRIFMVEDAVYNSTIATYRRQAAPVKVIKLGDPQTGWIPAPGAEVKLLEMLNRCEADPQSWVIYHYGINFEAWGTSDRAISIKGEHDVIEKVKLLALGLSKAFMTGETTYASAKSGLQVFLRRLLSLRQFLENIWLYPKFFRPISEINEWFTAKPSEVNHRYRIKRTAQEIEEQNMILMPTLKWRNKLDPSIDQDVMQAYAMLEKFGVRIAKSTVAGAVGLDAREELEKSMKEFKSEDTLVNETLGAELAQKFLQQGQQAAAPGAKPPGGPGAGAKPPAAGGKTPGGMDDASRPPGVGDTGGAMNEGLEKPEGGGIPTGVG